MAYAATSTRSSVRLGNRVFWLIDIVETGLTGVTDEYQITGLPAVLQVLSVVSTLTAGSTGSATQVDPQLGDLTNTNSVFENTAASAATREYPASAISSNSTQSLFWRAKANGTTSGTGSPGVRSRIVLVEGLK